jgi:hypothetical protein
VHAHADRQAAEDDLTASVGDLLALFAVEDLLRPVLAQELELTGEAPQQRRCHGRERHHERVSFRLDL